MLKRKIKNYLKSVGVKGTSYALLAKITNKTVLFKLDREDLKFPFYVRIPSSDPMMYKQIFINRAYDFVAKEHPETIIDAGANIGLASIYFTNIYPHAKIIAIEPEESNFKLLQKNTLHYPNIIPLQAALWNENGEINLLDTGRGKCGFMTDAKNASEDIYGKPCHSVEAITIDHIMKNYNLKNIDILKVDIEGAEKEVFEDTSSWIEKVNSIIIELHDRMKPGCSRSFYTGSNGFDNEWKQGENIYLSRNGYLKKPTT